MCLCIYICSTFIHTVLELNFYLLSDLNLHVHVFPPDLEDAPVSLALELASYIGPLCLSSWNAMFSPAASFLTIQLKLPVPRAIVSYLRKNFKCYHSRISSIFLFPLRVFFSFFL